MYLSLLPLLVRLELRRVVEDERARRVDRRRQRRRAGARALAAVHHVGFDVVGGRPWRLSA